VRDAGGRPAGPGREAGGPVGRWRARDGRAGRAGVGRAVVEGDGRGRWRRRERRPPGDRGRRARGRVRALPRGRHAGRVPRVQEREPCGRRPAAARLGWRLPRPRRRVPAAQRHAVPDARLTLPHNVQGIARRLAAQRVEGLPAVQGGTAQGGARALAAHGAPHLPPHAGQGLEARHGRHAGLVAHVGARDPVHAGQVGPDAGRRHGDGAEGPARDGAEAALRGGGQGRGRWPGCRLPRAPARRAVVVARSLAIRFRGRALCFCHRLTRPAVPGGVGAGQGRDALARLVDDQTAGSTGQKLVGLIIPVPAAHPAPVARPSGPQRAPGGLGGGQTLAGRVGQEA
jgi:hypothetical protein